MKVYQVWAKPPGRAAHPMLEIEPNQKRRALAVYVYSKGSRRFFEHYVPQTVVFLRCDLVVRRAGSGTVIAALTHAVPLVLVPIGAINCRTPARVLP